MNATYFTIGHSNQPIEDFLHALQMNGVASVIDVRKLPGSRANPQFNAESLGDTLRLESIAFRRIPELTGRRPRERSIPPEINSLWRNQSFHNYADYAMGDEFHKGLDDLVAEGRDRPTAVMCAEAVWWRCHRRLIADHLIATGADVQHIMPGGALAHATLTPGAVRAPGVSVTYPSP